MIRHSLIDRSRRGQRAGGAGLRRAHARAQGPVRRAHLGRGQGRRRAGLHGLRGDRLAAALERHGAGRAHPRAGPAGSAPPASSTPKSAAPASTTLIKRIEKRARRLSRTPSEYTLWPGPNSNTFVAWITRAVPELKVDLPATAIGKDYLGGRMFSSAPSGSGFQFSLARPARHVGERRRRSGAQPPRPQFRRRPFRRSSCRCSAASARRASTPPSRSNRRSMQGRLIPSWS